MMIGRGAKARATRFTLLNALRDSWVHFDEGQPGGAGFYAVIIPLIFTFRLGVGYAL